MSYQIKCNYIEKIIEIDIARFMGTFTPMLGSVYYLEDANEQLTGADLLSEDTNALPIYIQAKVSQGLKTITKKAASKRKNRSPLEDIREYRDGLSLDTNNDYFLYFQLRKKAEGAYDFQHNILMNYANTGYSHAFYVAPLIIDKVEYEKQFLDFNNFPRTPFYFHHYELIEESWTSYFGFIPFLRNHISIIPHERVNTHEHYYAYSKDGIDVTWHSPEFIDGNPSRLADRMVKIMRDYYYSNNKETIKSLANKFRKMPIMEGMSLANIKSIDIIVKHAQILERDYGIKQLLFVQRKS